jgi:hypothetical protein
MSSLDWGPLPEPWRRTLSSVVTSPADAKRMGAPTEWCALLGSGGIERVRAAWATSHELPLFLDYLSKQLDDIAIGVGPSGHVLLYRFRDWIDDGDAFAPGVMVAGLPMTAPRMEQLERTFGALPDGLRAVWSRHCFVQLKNGSMLVQPEDVKVLQTPGREYLAFVDSWSDLPTCLQRSPGDAAWPDDLVVFASSRSVARAGVSPTIDALLVDWATLRWPPESSEES